MKYRFLTMALLSACCIGNAMAAEPNDSVRDERGQTAVTTKGTCVRTKWNSDSDPCAPKVVEVPKPAPAPAPVVPPAPKPPEIALEQRTIYFDFDKSVLKPEGMAKLDSLAGMIKTNDKITKASVVGYADMMGEDDYNVKLSERRASAVNDYLRTRIAIPTEVLSVRALGESRPTASCDSEKNRAKKIDCLAPDRRVEVEFTYQK